MKEGIYYKKKIKIVFQGDSITDGTRDRRNYHEMGRGYPKYASEFIAEAYPNTEFEFINQGIGGNRTCQLFDRLYTDCLAFEPDIISVLIGINDIWHKYDREKIETTDEQFEANYRAILSRIKAQTNAKLLVLSPFLFDHESKAHFIPDLERRLPTIRKIAAEYADVYVPLDELVKKALETQSEPYFYSADGVHPNPNGAELIGKIYAEAIKPLIESI